MIEIGSPIWLKSHEFYFVTRIEAQQRMHTLEFAEIEGGSPVASTPTMDWYQPLSEPVFVPTRTLESWFIAPMG